MQPSLVSNSCSSPAPASWVWEVHVNTTITIPGLIMLPMNFFISGAGSFCLCDDLCHSSVFLLLLFCCCSRSSSSKCLSCTLGWPLNSCQWGWPWTFCPPKYWSYRCVHSHCSVTLGIKLKSSCMLKEIPVQWGLPPRYRMRHRPNPNTCFHRYLITPLLSGEEKFKSPLTRAANSSKWPRRCDF